MLWLIAFLFVLGYLMIALEDWLQINKTAVALLTGVLCWTVFALTNAHESTHLLAHHFEAISEILFFLLGAMTIVELVDAHDGFALITRRLTTNDARKLLWIIGFFSFFLSAVLDNLTTAIVMVSLLRKLMPASDARKLMAGVVVIAANAGGAWSPIGDVTTTMLWIGGQITTLNIIKTVFLPSLLCLVVPLVVLSFGKKLTQISLDNDTSQRSSLGPINQVHQNIILAVGVGGLMFVPVFKTITHLPPYMGMMLVLGVIWITSELIHKDKDEEERRPLTASYALSRIDSSSVLFFLGILLAVSALEVTHLLRDCATWLSVHVRNLDVIVTLIGLASAVVDNVPLVAATMGMYDLTTYPTDHRLWEFLAYCSGTGGSILIIGSAAGVAVMGLERIEFGWYLKRISGLALLGYLAGAGCYVLLN